MSVSVSEDALGLVAKVHGGRGELESSKFRRSSRCGRRAQRESWRVSSTQAVAGSARVADVEHRQGWSLRERVGAPASASPQEMGMDATVAGDDVQVAQQGVDLRPGHGQSRRSSGVLYGKDLEVFIKLKPVGSADVLVETAVNRPLSSTVPASPSIPIRKARLHCPTKRAQTSSQPRRQIISVATDSSKTYESTKVSYR